MTLDEALAEVTAAIDARLEGLRNKFENSLIENRAPEDALEDLLDFHEERQREWRSRALGEIRARLLDPTVWKPRDPSEAH